MSTVPFIPDPGASNSDLNVTVITISASLSFVGCFFIIVTYLWLRLTDQFHLKCWTACIAHMLLRVINYEDDTMDRYFKFYNLVSWGVPSIIVLALVARHVWFNALCDPKRISEYSIVRILFFAPLMLAWLYNVYAFFRVSNKLYKERRLHLQVIRLSPESLGSSVGEETPSLVNTQRLFLVAFAICWIWGILLAFFGFFKVHNNIDWLITVNYAFMPLPGLCNSIIFGMNDALKVRIYDFFNNHCLCCHKMTANDEAHDTLLGTRYNNEEFLLWRGNSEHDNNHSVQ